MYTHIEYSLVDANSIDVYCMSVYGPWMSPAKCFDITRLTE